MLSNVGNHAAGIAKTEADPLACIAQLLGCRVEDLSDETRWPADIRELTELIALWSKITDQAGRATVLQLARKLAQRA